MLARMRPEVKPRVPHVVVVDHMLVAIHSSSTRHMPQVMAIQRSCSVEADRETQRQPLPCSGHPVPRETAVPPEEVTDVIVSATWACKLGMVRPPKPQVAAPQEPPDTTVHHVLVSAAEASVVPELPM